jgi:hypothetical protein
MCLSFIIVYDHYLAAAIALALEVLSFCPKLVLYGANEEMVVPQSSLLLSFFVVGRGREKKADAFEGVDNVSITSAMTTSRSCDSSDHKNEHKQHDIGDEKKSNIQSVLEIKYNEHNHVDEDHDDQNDVSVATTKVRHVRSIYDRVAAERTAMLMSFNDRVGRHSALVCYQPIPRLIVIVIVMCYVIVLRTNILFVLRCLTEICFH